MRLGVAFIDLISGMNAVQAILAALCMRERTGRGQWLDISLTDSAAFLLANVASGYLNTGDEPARFGNAHPSIVPYQLFDCADGPLAVAVGNDEQFRRFCAAIGRSDLPQDSRFATNKARAGHRVALLSTLSPALAALPRGRLLADLRKAGVPAGEVRSVGEALGSDIAGLRETVVTVPDGRIGEYRSIRSPLRLSDSPFAQPSPPPDLGQHTAEVLAGILKLPEAEITRLAEAGVIGLGA